MALAVVWMRGGGGGGGFSLPSFILPNELHVKKRKGRGMGGCGMQELI